MDLVNAKIGTQKRIALIAHDNKKPDLVKWCTTHIDILKQHFLCGTGTTSKIIANATSLPVKSYTSGPLGGDLQIGSKIVDGEIDMMIFFWDPLESQPHDPDIKALLRIAAVYDIPIASTRATADFLITSKYMDEEYDRQIENFQNTIAKRVERMAR